MNTSIARRTSPSVGAGVGQEVTDCAFLLSYLHLPIFGPILCCLRNEPAGMLILESVGEVRNRNF